MKGHNLTTLCLALALLTMLPLSGCAAEAEPQTTEVVRDAAYYRTHNLPIKTLSDTEVLIESPAGIIVEEPTTFIEYQKMDDPVEQTGTIERLDYTTDVYEDGVTYEKFVNVYLPYGYDQNDTQTKYNVLYFQHGNTQTPDSLNNSDGLRWFDNLFASGKVDPVIIVFTSYYLYPDKADEIRVSDSVEGGAPAGDGCYPSIPANFYREVVEDIIPLVESKYNTYTERFDEAGLIVSREHRCFSGYSRGGFCTWYMFHSALPYFKWWSPMSGCCSAGQGLVTDVSNEDAYAYLKDAIDANPNMGFFIYVGGGNYTDIPQLRDQMAYFEKQDAFSYGPDPEVNNLYYTVSNFAHGYFFTPYYYYNTLQIIFSE